jgi:hypothetical protein
VDVAGESDFTSDEWLIMRKAMMSAGVLVSVSEGGKDDMISEMLAVSEQIWAARRTHPNQLVRELASIRRFQPGYQQGTSLVQFEADSLEVIRAATAIVSAKAPLDMPAFSAFLIRLAEVAANAHREGGFMGVGGTLVSEAEAIAIAKVKAALGA